MANKLDTFIMCGELDKHLATLTNLDRVVTRFSDDNDGAQYRFGMFVRTCKTAEDATKLVEQSKNSRYMGRKRHTWYPAVKAQKQYQSTIDTAT